MFVWDRGLGYSSLTAITALCPWARPINSCLVLVQPRKTRPDITEKLLTWLGHKKSNQANQLTFDQMFIYWQLASYIHFCVVVLGIQSSLTIILLRKRKLYFTLIVLWLSVLCISSSRYHRFVCGLWLWHLPVILTCQYSHQCSLDLYITQLA